ncbi:MAG: hypothetical protein ABTQ32_13400 [Myxococcaceae bacterium]
MTPLLSLAALEVACDEGVTKHLERLEHEALARPPNERFVLERVKEALSIHLALLQERPDALWPLLYSHCAFVDSPRARTFGVSTPGAEMPVNELVGRWLFERRALHPDTPWLRALTPTTPWGGALLAELRRFQAPVLSVMTETTVDFEVGQNALAWRFLTGETNPTKRHRWSLPQTFAMPAGGGLTFQRGDDVQWLIPPGWTVTDVSRRADCVVCQGSDLDETFAFVFDARTGEQLASIEMRVSVAPALSTDGAHLVWQTRDGIVMVRTLATGLEQGVAAAPASSLSVSPSGALVGTVEEGVVRVRRVQPLPAAARPFVDRSVGPLFSPDGSALLLGQYVLDGNDGSVKATHSHVHREYLEGGPAPYGVFLGRERLCVSEAFTTETLELSTRHVTNFAGVHASLAHRVAWSGDGRVFAKCQRQRSTVTLHTQHGQSTVEASGPLEAIALDQLGAQLALLHTDGTVELQAGGTRLRRFPGATALAFIADDRAIAVGSRTSTVVIGLDGTERWNANEPFAPVGPRRSRVEWLSGLRPPSLAESLWRSVSNGLLVVTKGSGRPAVFPSFTAEWVPSPSGATLVSGTTLLTWEPT